MKSLYFIIIGIFIGYFLGAYSFFNFTVNFGADKISQIVVESAKNVYSGSYLTGTTENISKSINEAIAKKKDEITSEITNKQIEIKDNLKEQLIQYMNSQINQLFGRI